MRDSVGDVLGVAAVLANRAVGLRQSFAAWGATQRWVCHAGFGLCGAWADWGGAFRTVRRKMRPELRAAATVVRAKPAHVLDSTCNPCRR